MGSQEIIPQGGHTTAAPRSWYFRRIFLVTNIPEDILEKAKIHMRLRREFDSLPTLVEIPRYEYPWATNVIVISDQTF